MSGVTNRIVEGYQAAEGDTEHDRMFDPERVAEGDEIVRPLIDGPALVTSILAASVSTMVVVDDLGEVGEGGEKLLEWRVIAAVSVQHHDGRALPHRVAVWDKVRAVDIDEQSNVAH